MCPSSGEPISPPSSVAHTYFFAQGSLSVLFISNDNRTSHVPLGLRGSVYLSRFVFHGIDDDSLSSAYGHAPVTGDQSTPQTQTAPAADQGPSQRKRRKSQSRANGDESKAVGMRSTTAASASSEHLDSGPNGSVQSPARAGQASNANLLRSQIAERVVALCMSRPRSGAFLREGLAAMVIEEVSVLVTVLRRILRRIQRGEAALPAPDGCSAAGPCPLPDLQHVSFAAAALVALRPTE